MLVSRFEDGKCRKEAITAYKNSLEAKSGKLEASDTESSDEEKKDVEEDEDKRELDVLIDDENNNDGEDLDGEVNKNGAEAIENEINDGDEDEAPVEPGVPASNSQKEPVLNPLRTQTRNKKIRSVSFNYYLC